MQQPFIRPPRYFNDLKDVSTTGAVVNDVPKFNGTEWVAAGVNENLAFGINNFTDNQASPQLVGPLGTTWRAAGAISFSASYNISLPDSAYIARSGWANIVLSDPFNSAVSLEDANYPAVGTSISFTLQATKNAAPYSAGTSVVFYNYVFYGVSTQDSAYDDAHLNALATRELYNSRAHSVFNLSAGPGERYVYALPTRLNAGNVVQLWVNGVDQTGGFIKETFSYQNSAGYAEDYDVYFSSNEGLGSASVEIR